MNGVRLFAFLFEFRRVSGKFQKPLGGVGGARQATHALEPKSRFSLWTAWRLRAVC